MTEQILDFDHSIIPQETGWWCGPASTQVVLNARGIIVPERQLADQIHTTVDGTGDITWITPILNGYVGPGVYRSVEMRDDPPTPAQIEDLWSAITRSIDDGYGLVANIVAPPGNFPIGIKGSQSPGYFTLTYHYIALMGYDPVNRAVFVADSGFWPWTYWVSLEQLATLIPPKGFATARNPLWSTILTQFIGPPRR